MEPAKTVSLVIAIGSTVMRDAIVTDLSSLSNLRPITEARNWDSLVKVLQLNIPDILFVSRRPVTFSQEVAGILRESRGTQIMHQMELGPAWQDTGFVFTRQDGRPMDPAKVTNAFAQVMKNASRAGVRLHDLRHTHASLMLQAGVYPKVVSERLGHASVGITLDTYSHVLPDVPEEAQLSGFPICCGVVVSADVARMLPNSSKEGDKPKDVLISSSDMARPA